MDPLSFLTPQKIDTLTISLLLAGGLFVVYLIWKYVIKPAMNPPEDEYGHP